MTAYLFIPSITDSCQVVCALEVFWNHYFSRIPEYHNIQSKLERLICINQSEVLPFMNIPFPFMFRFFFFFCKPDPIEHDADKIKTLSIIINKQIRQANNGVWFYSHQYLAHMRPHLQLPTINFFTTCAK